MWNDFKQFALRGNLIELAIAVVIGVAFTAVVAALVKDLITPLVAAIAGKPDFSGLTFTVHHSTFRYGEFLNALLSFLVVVTAIFFLVVKPLSVLMHRLGLLKDEEPALKSCPECTMEIPEAARRCPQCTAVLVSN